MSFLDSPRYQSKPLLRLLECYALRAIDELPSSMEVKLDAMAPKLAEIWQRDGKWFEMIAAEMNFPDTLPASIVKLWVRNQEIAKASNAVLTPQQFAEMFVDKNLV